MATARRRSDDVTNVVQGTLYLAVAAWFLSGLHGFRTADAVIAVAVFVLYVVACRAVVEHRIGAMSPTEAILVVMLFLLPLPVVPLLVLIAQIAADPPAMRRFAPIARTVGLTTVRAWHCIGPVLVLSLAHLGPPSLRHWPVYLLALAAQFAFDAVSGIARQLSIGTLAGMLVPMLWTFLLDTMLAVVGLSAVLGGSGPVGTLVLMCAPIGMIWLWARDRRTLAVDRADLGAQVEQVHEEARIDELTSLGNRRAWGEACTAVAGAVGRGEHGAVIMIDLDGLKAANDALGHSVGDLLIQAVASTVVGTVSDAVVCRVGGDEFGVLFSGPDALRVDTAMAEIRAAIERHPPVAGVVVSAGLGAAVCPPLHSLADAIHAADLAVLADKRARRAVRDAALRDLPRQATDSPRETRQQA